MSNVHFDNAFLTTEICFMINKIQHVNVTCVSYRAAVIFRPAHLQTKLEADRDEFSGEFALGSLKEWVHKSMYVDSAGLMFAETYSTASVTHHTLRPINSHFLYESGLSGYLVLCAP